MIAVNCKCEFCFKTKVWIFPPPIFMSNYFFLVCIPRDLYIKILVTTKKYTPFFKMKVIKCLKFACVLWSGTPFLVIGIWRFIYGKWILIEKDAIMKKIQLCIMKCNSVVIMLYAISNCNWVYCLLWYCYRLNHVCKHAVVLKMVQQIACIDICV